MSTKAWIIFAAVCVVLFGSLVVWSQRSRIDVSNVNEDDILSASTISGNIPDHVDGTKSAKVVLIEYGDYQCPGCGAAYPRLKAAVEKYGDHIAFVFRNFPLTTIHPNARAAAAAAEAAGLKEKYWAMHDKLYENQDEWSDASTAERTDLFEKYAREIELDNTTFITTLNSSSARLNQKISFDQALGQKVKVEGTPTIFLNGTKLNETQIASDETINTVIEAELKKQGVELDTAATGTGE